MAPPPDYTQQAVKLRLFIAVASVILLLAIIERAFDPNTHIWFRTFIQPPANEKFDNRIHNPGRRTALDPPGTIVSSADSNSFAEASKLDVPMDPIERAWQQGWKDVVARLAAADQSLLFELLYLALHRVSLAPEKTAPAEALIQHINQLWADYQTTAFDALADLKGDGQAQWIDVLRQVNDRFSGELRPALQSAVAGSLEENQAAALLVLQKTLVALAQVQIEDDTVVFRPAEREFWFYQLARVRDSSQPQSPKQPAPRVAYLQLHKQPANYRGHWVTVSGTARLAYRVPAPSNYLGIKEYVVYWLHPVGGPDSPILIYALAAPPNFPLPLSGSRAEPQKIREDIQVTGIFFKRAAYAAQGGAYTAPLLIAHTPSWHPAPAVAAQRALPFTAFQFAALALATLLIAIFITAVLWWRTARRTAFRIPHSAFLAAILLLPAQSPAQPLPWEPPPRSTEPVLRLPSNPGEVLERFEIGPTQLSNLVDNQPLSPGEHGLVLKILHCLPRLGRENLFRWRKADVGWDQLVAAPNDYRGQVFHLMGRALRAEKQSLSPEQAERYEFSHYFRVTLALDGSPHQAIILTRRIPAAWPLDQPLDEPASADALFLKPVGQVSNPPDQLLFAAPSFAWRPDQPNASAHIGPDQLALSKLGLDLSLWDDVRQTNDQPLTAADREGFYQLLAALSRPDAHQLRTKTKNPFDVVPLLKQPSDHFGQIMPVQGIARRALRVAVSDPDIQVRLGINHYYEIDLFVPLVGPKLQFEGEQKNGPKAVYESTFPVTLIVPSLPAGLPEGENMHELIRADGVFFKIWTYRSGYTSRVGQLQRAPLFVSANPRVVPTASTENWVTTMLVVTAFFLSLAMIGLVSWYYTYSDRKALAKKAARATKTLDLGL